MGILGSSEDFILNLYNNLLDSQTLEICSSCFFHGSSWLYSTTSTIYAYSINVWYIWDGISLYSESFDFFFLYCWFFSLLSSSFQLFFSVYLDLYLESLLYKFPFFDSWFRNIFNSYENSFILAIHPELLFLKKLFLTYYNYLYSNPRFVIYNTYEHESFLININIFYQYVLLIMFATLFIITYFSFFTNPFKEENFIDTDYLAASASVEAEKELSSFDDIILTFIVLFYIFGWYFYIHCWSLLSFMPELVLVFYLFPGLYFIILGIPTFLIWDFGIFFLVYLRGVGGSVLLSIELMYDYLAVIIFYTRILVQGVRLVLMLFTYISMHDVVLFFGFFQKMFLGSEFFWESLNVLNITLDTFSYYFLFSVPGTFIYWIYEILHTYFVVTIQFAAFFAIVFWLFLFLYTFFVLEKQENYFTSKRTQRKNALNAKKNLYLQVR